MNLRIPLSVLLGVMFLSVACATPKPAPSPDVPIAPDVTLLLPKQPPFGDQVAATQLIQAQYGQRHQVFQVLIQSSAERTDIVVTLPSGPRLMSIAWGAGGISSKIEPQVPDTMTAEHLLADMMLVYAPAATLKQALHGGALTTSANGDARKISKDGKDLIVITRPPEQAATNAWNGHAVLKNLAYDYRLDIKSVSSAP